jgi:hypothetical protein
MTGVRALLWQVTAQREARFAHKFMADREFTLLDGGGGSAVSRRRNIAGIKGVARDSRDCLPGAIPILFPFLPSMKRTSLVLALTLAALASGGCSHIPFIGKRKAHAAGEEKHSKHLATEVEKEFFDRWVEQRSAQLVSQGQPQDAARAQAVQEFKQKYPATELAATLP